MIFVPVEQSGISDGNQRHGRHIDLSGFFMNQSEHDSSIIGFRTGTYEQDIYITKLGIQFAQYETIDGILCTTNESESVTCKLVA